MKCFRNLTVLFLILPAAMVGAYPLDGDQYTGISRLEGYRLGQEGKVTGVLRLPAGALLNTEQVDLRLAERPDLEMPAADPNFTEEVVTLLGDDADRYGIAVLDLTDPNRPRYAEHRADQFFNPGSVGKLAVAMGIFQALAEAYPEDIGARESVLRDSPVVADGFIVHDHHKVPLWDPGSQQLAHRPIREGDSASLWTYLDWMMSASSNAAASMSMKHLVLLKNFGRDYPVSEARAESFFKQTPRTKLSALLETGLRSGVDASGLDAGSFRQGGFFTREGKRRVPGTSSYATPRELMRFLLHLEQGKVVDPFSSREIKRLMYMTQRRIRYASSPALYEAAVYFKSGSMYRCGPEPGFQCKKYQGNLLNVLNSVAIIEAPAGSDRPLFYMVVLTSNVLKENASWAHRSLATRLHELLERRHLHVVEDEIVEPDN